MCEKEAILKENPRISVIVPIYNVSEYLERCLNSIINQTYENLEIILVNDGSTDNSGEICDNYAKKDERIIVIHKENEGASDARNKGLDICRGEYISFIDSDDWIDLNMFSILHKEIVGNNCDISVVGYKKAREFKQFNIKNNSYTTRILPRTQAVTEGLDMTPWGKLYKKNLWENLRFPYQKTSEDTFVIYKIFYLSKKTIKIDLDLYYYFHRVGSLSLSKETLKKILDRRESAEGRMDFVCKFYPDFIEVECIKYFSIYCDILNRLYINRKDIEDSGYYIEKITDKIINSKYIKYLKPNNINHIKIALLRHSILALHLFLKYGRIVKKLRPK